MSTNNAHGLVSGLKAYYNNPLYSDLTLVCGDEKFKVHRMLLHEQSPVFRRMLSGGFSETDQKVITVHDNPLVFRALLKYLYSNSYDESTRGVSVAMPQFAVSLYAIADKYDYEPLRKAAARHLGEICDPKNNTNDFIATIYAIEANTGPHDTLLWNVVIPKIKANISTLCQTPRFLKMVTIDIPDLAVVLFQSLDQGASAVFRSSKIVQPQKVLPLSVGYMTNGMKEDDGDAGDSDDSDGMDMGHPGQSAPKRRAGPYRGEGRRLG